MIHVYTYRIMIPMICISIESMIPMILYTFKTSVLLFVERSPFSPIEAAAKVPQAAPAIFQAGKSWGNPWANVLGSERISLTFCTVYVKNHGKTMETLKKLKKYVHIWKN